MVHTKSLKSALSLALVALFTATSGLTAHASSHREAPLIAQDPQADNTDLYAFVSNNDAGQKVLNVIANYIGLEEPGGGPNYSSWSDDVLYAIHVENDATLHNGDHSQPVFTGKENLTFQLRFTTHYQSPGTFLTVGPGLGPTMNVGDAEQNELQTYSVTMVNDNTGVSTVLGTGLNVPPPNSGNATPLYNMGGSGTGAPLQGATSTSQLDHYTQQSIYSLGNGVKVFAGPRLDPFYADVGAIFDLLKLRNPGMNTLEGYNVHSIALQIPVSMAAPGPVPIVGVYASASRQAVTVRPPGMRPASAGSWTQVSRLGNPLFNEVFIGVNRKDLWNELGPEADAASFSHDANCPLLAGVLHPSTPCGYSDLQSIYIPDLLKVDTSTGPVRLDATDPGFSRLGYFGGDTVWSPFQSKFIGSGWPFDGRRLSDDVVDVALTAVASGPTLSPLTVVSDNVSSNEAPYNHVFPFVQTPNNGYIHVRSYP